MSNPFPLMLAIAVGLGACAESKVETAKPDPEGKLELSLNERDEAVSAEPGQVEVKLPGGLGVKVDVPGGLGEDAKFDIAGVGLYPGAKVGSIAVNALNADKPGGSAVVNIGFSAPADAAVVADWYEKQFAQKQVAIQRIGDTLKGKTAKGRNFTLALTGDATGTMGQLTVTGNG
jgi:hypothetical protein